MVSVYALKRKEPRVKLDTKVQITTLPEKSEGVTFETVTLDVSPHGASVHSEVALPLGSIVRFAAIRYVFETRAVVRSITPERTSGGYIVGLKSIGKTILEPGISAAVAVIVVLLMAGSFSVQAAIVGGLVWAGYGLAFLNLTRM